MQRARIIGPKNEKTATGAIFVRMCDNFFAMVHALNIPKFSDLCMKRSIVQIGAIIRRDLRISSLSRDSPRDISYMRALFKSTRERQLALNEIAWRA